MIFKLQRGTTLHVRNCQEYIKFSDKSRIVLSNPIGLLGCPRRPYVDFDGLICLLKKLVVGLRIKKQSPQTYLKIMRERHRKFIQTPGVTNM